MHTMETVHKHKYCIVKVRKKVLEFDEPTFDYESNIDEWKHKWPDGTVTWKLESHSDDFDRIYSLQRIFALAFLTWGKEIKNIKFRRLRRVGADADIPITFLPKAEDALFKSNPSVLAYAYFPTPNSPIGGDMVFNDDYYWTWNGASVNAHLVDPEHYPDPNTKVKIRTYNVQHTALHELGHSLGLRHNQSCNGCVMYPYYNGKVFLADNDIERIQNFYQKRSLPSWLYQLLVYRVKRGFRR